MKIVGVAVAAVPARRRQKSHFFQICARNPREDSQKLVGKPKPLSKKMRVCRRERGLSHKP